MDSKKQLTAGTTNGNGTITCYVQTEYQLKNINTGKKSSKVYSTPKYSGTANASTGTVNAKSGNKIFYAGTSHEARTGNSYGSAWTQIGSFYK